MVLKCVIRIIRAKIKSKWSAPLKICSNPKTRYFLKKSQDEKFLEITILLFLFGGIYLSKTISDIVRNGYDKQNKIIFKVPDGANKKNLKKNIEKIFKVNVTKINIINKQNRTKVTRGRKVKVSGYKKAIITLKKGQSIDLTTGI